MRCLAGFIYILISIFIIISIVQCEDENYFEDTVAPEELIDPHSFYYDKHSKKVMKDIDKEYVETDKNRIKNSGTEYRNAEQVVKHNQQENNYSNHEGVFYKRLVNMILSNLNVKIMDEVSIVGVLEIEVSHSQMKQLQNFHIQKTSLREIDEILSNIIKKPQYNYKDTIVQGFDKLYANLSMVFKIVQEHFDAAIIVLTILMICLTVRMITRGRGFSIFIFIQIIFVMSFFMTWWHLLQEAEVKSVAAQMKFAEVPISCQPHKMSWWDKFVSFMSASDDCEKYYQLTMSNPKLKVTPAHALSYFITTVILHPITHMGTVVSSFINNATEDLPWTYAWLIRCMLFLCVGLVIIILPFCLSGASFNLGLGPLLRFGIDYQRKDRNDRKERKSKSIENVKARDPVQIILQVPHATNVPAIENVSQIKKSEMVQISKSDTKNEEEENSTAESDDYEFCDDLSCGDAVTNTRLSECDSRERKKSKKLSQVKAKQNNGSGDS
ncbi:uncharacterized protein LOC143188906 [Calliopsis andreniformis]|uniref:uncharacterized protein LOC143188906 n=1 Tax=Calliopsis andreniformis TaxID=337506 RepID=UPI003FCCC0E2